MDFLSRLSSGSLVYSAIAVAMVLAWGIFILKLLNKRQRKERQKAKKLVSTLAIERYRSHSIMKSVKDAVITLHQDGTINTINPAAELLTGWTADKAIGMPYSMIVRVLDKNSGQVIADPSSKTREEGKKVVLSSDHYLLKRKGQDVPATITIHPVKDENRVTVGATVVLHTETGGADAKEKLNARDELTQLMRRSEFDSHVKTALNEARSQGTESALVCFDIDHFEQINAEFGRVAGDDILKQTATLLKKQIRKSDDLSRLGNDEFGLLLNNCKLDQAERITRAISKIVNTTPCRWMDRIIPISVCAGLTPININTTNTDPVAAAVSSCFVAKSEGVGKINIGNADTVADKTVKASEAEWIDRITYALQNDRFTLYKQTIQPLMKDESHRHYEILIRMLDAEDKIVPPLDFLSVAEQYSLMPAIDRWVVETTLNAQRAGEFGKGPKMHMCSINLSGQSLSEAGFKEFLLEQLNRHGVTPEKVCFEITESAVVECLHDAEQLIQEIKKIGCLFSLDDFGTGLSSFSYLKNLSVDFLKIDGSFVKDIATDPIDCAMVDSINHIGHVMGLQTIAEYAADKKIIQVLRTLRIDYAQGFGIARPEPLEFCLKKRAASKANVA
ncbi:MAG: hypothetical protein DSZ32_05480 [Gammaproteobacteria bacterium]|nr:MAG: hypothetical protein DSZ32_05480 [Gammaproteobacteria bacterium]